MNKDTSTQLSDAVESAKQAASDAAKQASQAVENTADAVKAGTQRAGEAVKDAASQLRQKAEESSISVESAKEFASDAARQASQFVGNTTDALRDAGQRAAESVKVGSQRAGEAIKDATAQLRQKAETTLAQTEECVREYPLSSVLGALAIGGLIGYALAASQREERNIRTRFAQYPLDTLREVVSDAVAPYAQQLRKNYRHAREVTSDTLDHLHDSADHHRGVLAKAAHRVADNLKFW